MENRKGALQKIGTDRHRKLDSILFELENAVYEQRNQSETRFNLFAITGVLTTIPR